MTFLVTLVGTARAMNVAVLPDFSECLRNGFAPIALNVRCLRPKKRRRRALLCDAARLMAGRNPPHGGCDRSVIVSLVGTDRFGHISAASKAIPAAMWMQYAARAVVAGTARPGRHARPHASPGQFQIQCHRPAAARMRSVTSLGWETSDRWPASISTVVACMRFARNRSRSGLIVLSCFDTA